MYRIENPFREKAVAWLCRCDCGNLTISRGTAMKYGHKKSCGCSAGNPTHRMSGTAIYRLWQTMISRCHNPNSTGYEYYGQKGIRVCRRWRKSFTAFTSDMGERPKGLTLDRKNSNGDYCPSNCRWATFKEQGRNRMNNRWITFKGKRMTITECAERYKKSVITIRNRLKRGWSTKDALTAPIQVHVRY